MEDRGPDSVAAFDTLFTTNHIQMMKVLLPYLDPRQQGAFAVYIKLMELKYTFSFFQNHPYAFPSKTAGEEDTLALCDEILPFCGPEEKNKVENMKSMMQNMGKMKEMMEMMQMMQEMFPDGMGGAEGSPADFLSGMSGMDLSSIMEMLGK